MHENKLPWGKKSQAGSQSAVGNRFSYFFSLLVLLPGVWGQGKTGVSDSPAEIKRDLPQGWKYTTRGTAKNPVPSFF
jgi:hypothetical protein